MAVIREKNLLDPQKRIDELKNQIVILEAEMVLVETLRDQDKLRGMGFRKWNLIRHLGYWQEIVEHQKHGRHLRAWKTHDLNVCVCSVLNCEKMQDDKPQK
jgi:hypothetical protein